MYWAMSAPVQTNRVSSFNQMQQVDQICAEDVTAGHVMSSWETWAWGSGLGKATEGTWDGSVPMTSFCRLSFSYKPTIPLLARLA